jgi:hypothetical protein
MMQRVLFGTMALAGALFTLGCGSSGGAASTTGVSLSSNGGTTYSIAGQATDALGDVLQGVTIAMTGASTATTTTDIAGSYQFTQEASGTYLLTATLNGYTFTPATATVVIASADATQDFTATLATTVNPAVSRKAADASNATETLLPGPATHAIAGFIGLGSTRGATTATQGAEVKVSGNGLDVTAMTDANGHFTVPGLTDGTYTVTPILPYAASGPATQTVVVSHADSAELQFIYH